MVPCFCLSNQAKIEACNILSTLHQCDPSEPSMVVVRRYSNTPYIPTGLSHSFYPDVGTFSGDATSTQFPLDMLHLCQLLPFNRTGVMLPCEEGEESLETYPLLFQRPMGKLRRGILSFCSNLPVSPLVGSSLTSIRVQTYQGRVRLPPLLQTSMES